MVFAAAAVSIQVTDRPSVAPASTASEPPHLVTIWFSSRGAAKRVSFWLQFRFVFQFFGFSIFQRSVFSVQFSVFSFQRSVFSLFSIPFSAFVLCMLQLHKVHRDCNWPNASRKLNMEINYDTNATNERDKIESPLPLLSLFLSALGLCVVVLCRINYLAAPNGN